MKTLLLVIGFVLATTEFAEAQQPKLPLIGFVGTASASAVASRAADKV